MLRSAINVLGLMACSLYCTIPLFWLVVHRWIHRWRRWGRRAYMRVLPIWTAFILAAFLILWPFRFAHFYANWFAWIPAALSFVLGLFVYRAAFKDFKRSQVSGLAELEPQQHHQHLVTSGVRAHVRHPIYLGHLCEVCGWCVATGMVALYFLAAFAIVTGAVMIRIEDRELEARFGDAYRAYRTAVPAVIPHMRR